MSDNDDHLIVPDVATETPTREQAYHLIYEQYLARGYTRAKNSGLWLTLFDGLEDTTTLIIMDDQEEVVRTLTLVPDGPMGLPADDLFKDILDNLRAQGRLGEVSGFAANPDREARIESAVILVNTAAMLGMRHGLTHFVITVHPRHMGFYKRGLGFEPVGEVRSYDKVDGAPARLLAVDLKEAIKAMHGRGGLKGSLYRRFWTPDDARRTTVRLVGEHRPMSIEQLHHFFQVKTPLWEQASPEWQSALLGGRKAPEQFTETDAGLIVPPPKNIVVAQPAEHRLLDRQTFHALVRAGIRAPSAYNSQPWSFARLGDDLEVFYARERAITSDVADLFGLIALGAAVESIILEAGARGLASEVIWDDERYVRMEDLERIARIRLTDKGEVDPLVQFLSDRRTDRRPYSKEALTDEEVGKISRSVAGVSTRFQLIDDREHIERVGRIVALADRIRLETPWLYEELRASLRMVTGATTGLEISRMGAPLGAGQALPWVGPWSRMKVLNMLGASLLAGSLSQQKVTQSGALGLLSLDIDSDEGKLTGGRDMLRIWLAAQSLGLSVQPVGALPLLLARVHAMGGEGLSPEHTSQLQTAQAELEEIFPSEPGQRPALLLRLGRPRSPPEGDLSERLAVEDVVVETDKDG